MNMLDHTFLLLSLNFFVFTIIVIVLMSLTYIIPFHSWRYALKSQVGGIISCFYSSCALIIKGLHLSTLNITSTSSLKKHGWYLIIANHATWLDILSAGIFFKFKIPSLKFFMKKELLWSLPLGGLACYLADFPFIERTSKSKIKKNPKLKNKDIKTTQALCRKLVNYPTALIIFPEGTRFNPEKQKKQQSPFHYLLKPKAAGIATVIQEMGKKLDGIIDLTLSYSSLSFSVWDFLCGKVKTITIHYDIIPITDDWKGDYQKDRTYRVAIQQKMNERWEKKDQLLRALHHDPL